jgi:hypothetical protein
MTALQINSRNPQYLMVKYSKMDNDTHANKSGNIANGPRPKARKPKSQCINGFDESAYRSRVIENINNPIVNSDFVFLYISIYPINKKISSMTLIEEITVLTV